MQCPSVKRLSIMLITRKRLLLLCVICLTLRLPLRILWEQRNLLPPERYLVESATAGNPLPDSNIQDGQVNKDNKDVVLETDIQLDTAWGEEGVSNKKLNFIIHVGPGKTASTSLQHDLRELHDVLQKDHYVYLGLWFQDNRRESVLQAQLFQKKCLKRLAEFMAKQQSSGTSGGHNDTFPLSQVPCWKGIQDRIHSYQQNQTSIILSSNLLSDYGRSIWDPVLFDALVRGLRDTLNPAFWNTPKVVVYYRRYFEWALSSYKQQVALTCASPKGNWQFHKPCRPPWDYIQNWMNRTHPSAKNYHYVPQILELWQQNASFPVILLNYHAKEHVTESFVCHALPDAVQTCAHTRTRQLPDQVNVRSTNTAAYTSIAYSAYQRGILTNDHKRVEIIQEMERLLVNMPLKVLPLTNCPSLDERQKLLELSLSFERTLKPALYASSLTDEEDQHRESFCRLMDEKQEFCGVDVEAILANKTEWSQVMESLLSLHSNYKSKKEE